MNASHTERHTSSTPPENSHDYGLQLMKTQNSEYYIRPIKKKTYKKVSMYSIAGLKISSPVPLARP